MIATLDPVSLESTPHPLIPRSPCIVIVCADEGAGKTSLLAQVAAAKTRAGKKVLYIYGEGSPEKNEELMITAGADMAFMIMVDCIVEHPDVQLDGMTRHEAIAKLLPGVNSILIDTHSNFTSESVRRHTIRRLLAPFHALARKGVTTYLAMHPNRYRNVRKAAEVLPAGWAGSAEIVWQIEVDDQGHGVLEMTRGREYPKPWARYEFWQGASGAGVRLAVIGNELPADSPLSIMYFLREKDPRHLPPSVADAREWLLAYLAEHGRSLVEKDIIPAGKAAGHSEPALVKAKAISKGQIEHTPQGTGPSQWFLTPKPVQSDDSVDSVDPVSDKDRERNQRNQPFAKTCP